MILTVTLNPAVDKTYRTDELYPGMVNRMRSVTNLAGGKGINVSRILHQYDCPVLATGFLGGHMGSFIESCLDEEGIKRDFVHVEGETRCSMNVVADNGYVTEILEPGPVISDGELGVFKEKFQALLEECDLVVLSGSIAQGLPEDIYAQFIGMAAERGRRVFLDTSSDVLRCGLKAGPFLVKPNKKELEYVIGHRLDKREDILAALDSVFAYGVKLAAVSLGSKGLLLADREQCLFAKAPRVRSLNTVGCGDSVVASMVISVLRGDSMEEMLRAAAAVSAAGATTFESGRVPVELAEELKKEIVIEKVRRDS